MQKHPNHKQTKVLGTHMRPTPTILIAENQRSDQSRIVPTTAQGKNTNLGINTKSLVASISPMPSSVALQQSVTEFPSQTITPSMQNTTVYAKTTIITGGKTIHLSMQYPSLGGSITGTMSGDCAGRLAGTYAGPSAQTLNGTGTATCPMGFMSIPVSITYTGRLLSSTLANISYSATVLGKTENGETELVLTR